MVRGGRLSGRPFDFGVPVIFVPGKGLSVSKARQVGPCRAYRVRIGWRPLLETGSSRHRSKSSRARAYQAGMPGMSSQGRGELRRSDALWWLRACWLAGLVAAPFVLSGCAVSKFSNPFGAGSPDTSASAVTEDRLLRDGQGRFGQRSAGRHERALPASGGLAARPAADHLPARPCRRQSRRGASRRDHQDGARVPDLFRSRGGAIRLRRARAARAQGHAWNGKHAGQHARRRHRAEDARHRQDDASPRPCRKETRSAISRWCGRSPSPSRSARRPEDYKVFVAFDRTQPGAG